MKNREEGGKDGKHFKGKEPHLQDPRMREYEVLCLEPRMQNDPGPDYVGPQKARSSSGLYPSDFEQKCDGISSGLLVDHPGEGTALIGGWQVWNQGKQQEVVSEKRSPCPGLG